MKLRMRLLLLAIAVAVGVPLASRAGAVGEADIDKAVAALADYDAGKPRRPLFEVEDVIRKAAGRPEILRHLEQQLLKLLEANPSHECKLFICQQLWAIGTDASVPVLQRMLADETTAHLACYALGTRPSPLAGKALRDALAKAQGNARLAIIALLGDRRDVESIPALSRLAGGQDATVAEAAIAALGRIGTEPAADALAALRAKAPARLRLAASQAWLYGAGILAAEGRKDKPIAVYNGLLAAGEPKLIRRGALVGLMDAAGADAVPLVIATVRGDDAMLRATAISRIATLRGEGVAERFAAELPRLPADVQALLIDALAERGDAAVRAAVARATTSEHAEVRLAGLRALGRVGDAASVELLTRAVAEGGSEREARVALTSLRLLRGEGVDAAIVRGLKSARDPVRAALIQVLSDRGASEAVPALLDEAAGRDEMASEAAFKALGRLAGEEHLPALIRLLVGLGSDALRKEAELAIVQVAHRMPDESRRSEAALAALRGAERVPTRCSLLRVLRGIGDARAFEAVQAAVRDANAEVRDAAVRALAAWPDARALDALLDVFRAAKGEAHRVVALRGVVRLLGLGQAPAEETVKAYAALMADVRRPEEKKLVLGGLATASHPAALRLVEPCLDDEAVRAEAELALLQIARTVVGADRDQGKAAATRLLAVSKDAERRQQAEQLLRQADALGDYLTAWQVTGPHTDPGKEYTQLFHVPFPPEESDAKGVAWRLLPLGRKPAQAWMHDLAAALGEGEHRVAYVRTWVHADKEQPARLELGTDDGNKVWLNGQVVHAANVGGAAVPGQYKVDVKLRHGWNTLLVKITQATGPWEFCARLAARDGGRLADLKVQAYAPAAE